MFVTRLWNCSFMGLFLFWWIGDYVFGYSVVYFKMGVKGRLWGCFRCFFFKVLLFYFFHNLLQCITCNFFTNENISKFFLGVITRYFFQICVCCSDRPSSFSSIFSSLDRNMCTIFSSNCDGIFLCFGSSYCYASSILSFTR